MTTQISERFIITYDYPGYRNVRYLNGLSFTTESSAQDEVSRLEKDNEKNDRGRTNFRVVPVKVFLKVSK